MKLYHGTTKKVAEKALKEGLKPRGTRKGNWKHTVDSRRDAVYMTDVYGLYFAYTACKGKDVPAVIEIDVDLLDQNLLIPDEDFLEQASRNQEGVGLADTKKNMKERTEYYRKVAEFNKHLWERSLEGLGTVSYQGIIPPEAISRIAYISVEKQSHVLYSAADAMICLLNHKFCSQKYAAGIRWLFGEEISAIDWFGFGKEFVNHVPKATVEAAEKMLKNREGIEIYEPKEKAAQRADFAQEGKYANQQSSMSHLQRYYRIKVSSRFCSMQGRSHLH